MIELLGGLARWLTLVCGLVLPGLGVWLLINPQHARARASAWLLGVGGALALILLLATQTAAATGEPASLWQPAAWLAYARDTHAGRWLGVRILLLLLAGSGLWLAHTGRLPARAGAASGLFTLLALSVSALTGHAAAAGVVWAALHALHLATASLWLGGLFALLGLPLAAASALPALLRSFSALALPLMSATLLSGLLLAWNLLEPQFAGLVATAWGAWLLLKLLLLGGVLGIAARLRWRDLPRLEAAPDPGTLAGLRAQLRMEFLLALGLLVGAAGLGLSPPAGHVEIAAWPWPFRFSLDGTLPEPGTLRALTSGGALLVLGVAALLAGRSRPGLLKAGIGLGLLGSAVMLRAVAVPASAETYRRPSVTFDALSIANGAALYASHCTGCHGAQGKGDGPLASSLPRRPVDLLTEPHTARHTAGDFLHWIGAGIPDSGMPGFARELDEDARWDLINYLHALNRGYDARVLQSRVVPARPEARLAAPEFSWATGDGRQGLLSDWRGAQNVLLVFYTLPASAPRLAELAAMNWGANPPALLAIPLADEPGIGVPFEVTGNAAAIAGAYGLFRRTLANPDLFGSGALPAHMEVLIDRFGYMRARWIPQEEPGGWSAPGGLLGELARLAGEPQILPPPSAHVH